MIDDVLKQFGLPVDMAKLAGTVDLLWEQRERLTEVLRFVSDNTEQLTKLLELVRDHGDELVEVIRRLSDLVGRAGSGVEAAGTAAQTAGRLLMGGLSEAPGADAVVAFAAGSLDRGRALVADAGGLLRSVSERLDRAPLAGEAASAMRSGGARVDELAEQLAEVAQRLTVLGRRLGDAVVGVGGVGATTAPAAAGAAASTSFFAPPAPAAEPVPAPVAEPAAATNARAAARKPVAKKAAAKKKAAPAAMPVAKKKAAPTKAAVKKQAAPSATDAASTPKRRG
jgi:hypothetical protein